jgi:phosphopantetheine--protein transferase-like protein
MQQAVVEQFLSPSEWSQLQRLPSNASSAALFRWTRKEAVLKAAGVGLLYPVRHLDVLVKSESAQIVSLMGRKWLLWQVDAPKLYAAAAAIEQSKGEFAVSSMEVRGNLTGTGRPRRHRAFWCSKRRFGGLT